MKKKARWPWLIAAALLLALAAWLATGSDPVRPDKEVAVNLPRQMESEDWARAQKRQTLPAPQLLPQQKAPSGRAAVRDPLLRAIPSKVERAAVVVEANAIRNSDLGNLLVECAFSGDDAHALELLRDAGFDPLNDLDRVAVADGTLMVTGNFGKMNWKSLGVGDDTTSWGDNGKLLSTPGFDGGAGDVSLGTWNNQMLVLGDSQDDVKAALDRIENRGSDTEPPAIDPSQSYGEIYGVLMAEPLAQMFDDENPQLANSLRAAANQVQLHVDATHDVGVVADFGGADSQKSDDLRKVMGSALSLMKMKAKAEGDENAAQVLDLAHVEGNKANGFRMEAGLPYDFMKKQLEACVEAKKKHAREKKEARDDAGS